MVAELEKDILGGREFAKGDVWRNNEKTGKLVIWRGIHRGIRMQTGVIQVKKHDLFWKFSLCYGRGGGQGVEKKRKWEKKKAELMIYRPRMRNSKKDLVVGI
jgi:hypothetical protein